MAFTTDEKKEFIRLLGKVAENGYYFPDEECMRAAHNVISMWAAELVVLRFDKKEEEILLAVYEGAVKQFRNMWHIPGGYNQWPESDIQATCSRIALREIGVDVRYMHVINAYKWKSDEHPYGHPLSLYVRCELNQAIKETEKLRFFFKSALPPNMIKQHKLFIEKYL